MTLDKQEVESPDAPSALGPYSQAIRTTASTFVFVSGQLGIRPDSGDIVGDTIEAQTRRALENLLAVVAEAGGDAQSVIKTTVYLVSMADFGGMNEVYSTFFAAPHPARACVAVGALPKGALVQIEAVAAVE